MAVMLAGSLAAGAVGSEYVGADGGVHPSYRGAFELWRNWAGAG